MINKNLSSDEKLSPLFGPVKENQFPVCPMTVALKKKPVLHQQSRLLSNEAHNQEFKLQPLQSISLSWQSPFNRFCFVFSFHKRQCRNKAKVFILRTYCLPGLPPYDFRIYLFRTNSIIINVTGRLCLFSEAYILTMRFLVEVGQEMKMHLRW